jgi:outer membrane protein assembly factor BamA
MTKHVPDNKYLLSKVSVKVDNNKIKSKDIDKLVRQKPNKRILWFTRFHLALYNLSNAGDTGKFSKTFRRIGEEPVIYDELLTGKTNKQIQIYLQNKGYYNSVVTDSVALKNKVAKVYYHIYSGIPYVINKINYNVEDSVILAMLIMDIGNRQVNPGQLFDVDKMQDERMRIETLLKNRGYYNFTKESVYFEADSSLNNNSVNLLLGVKNFTYQNSEGAVVSTPHKKYKIRSVTVDYDTTGIDTLAYVKNGYLADTMVNMIKFLTSKGLPIKPGIISHNIFIGPDQVYAIRNVENTYKGLSSLRTFKFINIQFEEANLSDSTGNLAYLDCTIKLAIQKFQSYQTEVEMTYTSGFGVAGNLVYQHKNLFKGAEIFDLKLKGATEAVKKENAPEFKNTLELGIETKIQVPKFILPFKSEQFIKKYNPKTSMSLSYNYIVRPDYTHSIANATFGYIWKGNRYTTFIVNPVELNYVNLLGEPSAYITNLSDYLKNSFMDHMISATSISYTYNNQRYKRNTQFTYFRINAETAGNSSTFFNRVFNSPTDSLNTYSFLYIRYAQYVKADIEFRYYQPVNETDRVVYRLIIGAAYAYGNSSSVPFEKQFFIGGGNSIRAWQVRSLGPGSYNDTVQYTYPNQTSDLKIETNIEYRFKLFWVIEGALFIDAGNIWSINKNEQREGAKFNINTFYKDAAIGSGFGTRFDFSFLLLRLDLGFKVYDPTIQTHRWSFGKKITWDYFYPTIGIAYPF